jgi:hypothetical protein
MASSVRSSAYAFVAEVARYLAVEPGDVKRMIRLDSLPETRIPKQTRTVARIYLPDFHAWLLSRSSGETRQLADYPAWLAEFNRIARTTSHHPVSP